MKIKFLLKYRRILTMKFSSTKMIFTLNVFVTSEDGAFPFWTGVFFTGLLIQCVTCCFRPLNELNLNIHKDFFSSKLLNVVKKTWTVLWLKTFFNFQLIWLLTTLVTLVAYLLLQLPHSYKMRLESWLVSFFSNSSKVDGCGKLHIKK